MKNDFIKVAMVDDHVLLRNALSALINNSGKCKVIFEASNGKELIAQLENKNFPNVVILDVNMPEMNGHETAAYLQQHFPEIKVLMLTMYDSDLALIRLLKAGVKGFMKNVELAAGGLPLQRMPNFLRSIFAWVMPRFGPRGLEFAKARIEMKAIESVIHLRSTAPHKIKNMVPSHVWKLVRTYGLEPRKEELKDSRESTYS